MQRHTILLYGQDSLLKTAIACLLREAKFRFSEIDPSIVLLILAEQAAIATVKASHPKARLMVIANRVYAQDVIAAIKSGVAGYVSLESSAEALIKSIELVMLGEAAFPSIMCGWSSTEHAAPETLPPTVMSQPIAMIPSHRHDLSARETSILDYLTEGCSNKSIARKLEICEATVKVHVKAILRKIGVNNRTQAAMWRINSRAEFQHR